MPDNAHDIRLVLCPICGSEGFIEHGHPNAPDADWVGICRECEGTGSVIADVEPIGEDDIAEAFE